MDRRTDGRTDQRHTLWKRQRQRDNILACSTYSTVLKSKLSNYHFEGGRLPGGKWWSWMIHFESNNEWWIIELHDERLSWISIWKMPWGFNEGKYANLIIILLSIFKITDCPFLCEEFNGDVMYFQHKIGMATENGLCKISLKSGELCLFWNMKLDSVAQQHLGTDKIFILQLSNLGTPW